MLDYDNEDSKSFFNESTISLLNINKTDGAYNRNQSKAQSFEL